MKQRHKGDDPTKDKENGNGFHPKGEDDNFDGIEIAEEQEKKSIADEYLPNRDYAHPFQLLFSILAKPLLYLSLAVLVFIVSLNTPLADVWDDMATTVSRLFSSDQGPTFEEKWANFERLVLTSKMPKEHLIQDGKLYHRFKNTYSITDISRSYLRYTDYVSSVKLREVLKNNPKIVGLKDDPEYTQAIQIPKFDPKYNGYQMQPVPILKANPNIARNGLYLAAGAAGSSRLYGYIDAVKRTTANAIVFDIKDVWGSVSFPSKYTVAETIRDKEKYTTPVKDLAKLVKVLKSHGIYTIARLACFQDMITARNYKEWSIKRTNGELLLHKGKPLWLDPGLKESHNYLLQLVHEVALSGVDEVQFDYIRYPAEGNLDNVVYRNVSHYKEKTKFIRDFLKKAGGILEAHNIVSSIDVFGIVAWGFEGDVKSTAQNLSQLSYEVDVISPMLYPSHFNDNFEGIKKPGDAGHYFLYHGTKKVKDLVGDRAVIRSWIQAFGWRVSNYNVEYVREQIRGINDAGGVGWLAWNAGNKYDKVYAATPAKKK